MNVGIGTEAAQFPEKESINRIFVEVNFLNFKSTSVLRHKQKRKLGKRTTAAWRPEPKFLNF
jgi:hypothetical protein